RPPPRPRPRRGPPRPAAPPVPSGPGTSPDPRDLCPVSHHACDRERSAGQYGARYPPEMREAPEPPAPPNRVRVLLPVPGSLPPDGRLSQTPQAAERTCLIPVGSSYCLGAAASTEQAQNAGHG